MVQWNDTVENQSDAVEIHSFQDFLLQATQSAPCRPVDSREPCCDKPPKEDTGEATLLSVQFFYTID